MTPERSPREVGRGVSEVLGDPTNSGRATPPITAAIAVFAAYALVFPFLYNLAGSGALSLGLVPVIALAWRHGLWMGALSGVLLSLTNLLTLAVLGDGFFYILDVPLMEWLIPVVVVVLLGAFVGYVRDLRAKLQIHHEALVRMSERDGLTDLLDRSTMKACLDDTLLRGGLHAVLYVDLDGFKRVNDTYGHATGDAVLRAVAERLTYAVRPGDLVARIGGDEFVIALLDVSEPEIARSIAARTIESLTEPLDVADAPLYVTCSIGISYAPEDGATADDLLHAAAQAMYEAKVAGKNRCCVARESSAPPGESVTPFSLQRAHRSHEFVLAYQPQAEVASGRVVGLEALIRWEHPKLGRLSPAQFLPQLESTRLIVPVGEWVLHEACRQAVLWSERGWEGLSISVNVSPIQIRHSDFVAVVDAALSNSGLDPARLELEITETSIIEDFVRVAETVSALSERGVRFALDDFGAGYTRLSYLHQFDWQTLKLDRSLLECATATTGAVSTALPVMRAVIGLAHELGKEVLIEGVETDDQLHFSTELGCDRFQGYLLAKPLDPDAVGAWLEARHAGVSMDRKSLA